MNPVQFFAVPALALMQLLLIDSAFANEVGRAAYQSVCMACHAPENVMVSSPKAGDVVEWNKRLAKGLDSVTDNAVNGYGAMPPKGGSSQLSREQIRSAIEYMASSSKK